eukprot:3235166-Rhodomonas_salina.3
MDPRRVTPNTPFSHTSALHTPKPAHCRQDTAAPTPHGPASLTFLVGKDGIQRSAQENRGGNVWEMRNAQCKMRETEGKGRRDAPAAR